MTFEEGTKVRLVGDVTRDDGVPVVPAGTVGTVVDAVNAPDEYAVDVVVDGEFDNVPVTGDQIEAV
ncbi:MAG: hypothetical protein GEV07_06135 [Streptosporangiales bacterium]|nr:hypothetical protein [Streptosporangiales bacterium]